MESPRDPDDELVRRETDAARADVDRIAGASDADTDPAERPVAEGGGGEAEGFELAEQELVDNAEHGDGGADPLADAMAPEEESDRSTAEYGDADHEAPSG